ncbi:MAG: DUF2877 domain-containing protein, partial [Clostridia bacterium]|nr:DUF2877 domain-containing protein [Clostridia bacterium]
MIVDAVVAPEFFDYAQVNQAYAVCGVFSGSIYLECPRGLILLHDARYSPIPFGVGIRNIAELFNNQSFSVGQTAHLSNTALVLCDVIMQFHTLALPPLTPPPALKEALTDGYHRGLEALRQKDAQLALLAASAQTAPTDPFLRAAYQPLASLRRTLLEGDGHAASSVEKLLGLGSGLTLALDDVLCGLCTLLLAAKRVWHLPLPGTDALCRTVAGLAPLRTNRYSAAYILCAAKGDITGPLH